MSKLVPLGLVVAVLIGGLLAWKSARKAREEIEGPQYEVEQRYDGFEVRSYSPQIQAQVTLEGSRDQVTTEGFRILAGYIFGGNTAQQKVAMTAPVSTQEGGESQTISMTAPVSSASEAGSTTVTFMMPGQWTLDTLPVPDDERIRLVEVPGYRAAVRSFPMRATPRRIARQEAQLREAMASEGLSPEGALTVSQFDPPWVLPPLRYNEVELRLE